MKKQVALFNFRAFILSILLSSIAVPVVAETEKSLSERIDRLEAIIAELKNSNNANDKHKESSKKIVGTNSKFGYDILDQTTNINRKQQLILSNKQDGTLRNNTINLEGAVTAIANYQRSNEADRFGYLMRHPTGANQVGKTVSEATIHSSQLGLTASLGSWTTAHFEMLFDPEQSFGSGTNTDLERNQVQVRQAYVLFGNLNKTPWYASLGKMTIPFGLTDTVSPFTASTVWHAFGGLANGATIGYLNNKFNASFMFVQGGSQFRSANTPVENTNVPSRLNNYAIDINYTFDISNAGNLLLGASYQKGSAYCQSFPITHFSPCQDNNPAFDIYAKLDYGNWVLKSEFAQTTDEWPGTFNPVFPQFEASKVTSFDIGIKHHNFLMNKPVDYSLEFSQFETGPDGSEWELQSQLVAGIALKLTDSVKLFGEYIHTDGFAPLNFLTGGLGGDPAVPLSSRDSKSDILLIGVNAAF